MPVAKDFYLLKTQSSPSSVALFGKYSCTAGIVIETALRLREGVPQSVPLQIQRSQLPPGHRRQFAIVAKLDVVVVHVARAVITHWNLVDDRVAMLAVANRVYPSSILV